jgi:hypothetical protein
MFELLHLNNFFVDLYQTFMSHYVVHTPITMIFFFGPYLILKNMEFFGKTRYNGFIICKAT